MQDLFVTIRNMACQDKGDGIVMVAEWKTTKSRKQSIIGAWKQKRSEQRKRENVRIEAANNALFSKEEHRDAPTSELKKLAQFLQENRRSRQERRAPCCPEVLADPLIPRTIQSEDHRSFGLGLARPLNLFATLVTLGDKTSEALVTKVNICG
jgi:hypothetical protein